MQCTAISGRFGEVWPTATEVTVRFKTKAARQKVSMAAARAQVISELESLFHFERRAKNNTDGFSQWRDVFG